MTSLLCSCLHTETTSVKLNPVTFFLLLFIYLTELGFNKKDFQLFNSLVRNDDVYTQWVSLPCKSTL